MSIDYNLSHVPAEWLDIPLLPGIGPSMHRPVLALTITNGSLMLVCVRDPKTNSVHPNVLSVPTIRMPNFIIDRPVRQTAARLLRTKLDTSTRLADRIDDSRTWNGHSLIGTLDGNPVTYPLTMTNAHIETDTEFPAATGAYSWISWVEQASFLEAVRMHDASPLAVDAIVYGLCTTSTSAMLQLDR